MCGRGLGKFSQPRQICILGWALRDVMGLGNSTDDVLVLVAVVKVLVLSGTMTAIIFLTAAVAESVSCKEKIIIYIKIV